MGPPVASPYEQAAWVLTAVGLGAVLYFHLVPGLVAGLLVSVLLSRLARGLAGRRLAVYPPRARAVGCERCD